MALIVPGEEDFQKVFVESVGGIVVGLSKVLPILAPVLQLLPPLVLLVTTLLKPVVRLLTHTFLLNVDVIPTQALRDSYSTASLTFATFFNIPKLLILLLGPLGFLLSVILFPVLFLLAVVSNIIFVPVAFITGSLADIIKIL